jgi:hypothetical protein
MYQNEAFLRQILAWKIKTFLVLPPSSYRGQSEIKYNAKLSWRPRVTGHVRLEISVDSSKDFEIWRVLEQAPVFEKPIKCKVHKNNDGSSQYAGLVGMYSLKDGFGRLWRHLS